MRQQRSYAQPSCVLQVWWESGGYVNDRLVVQELGFILRFSDQQTLAGDLGQLWALANSIDAYLQKFLSQDYLSAMVHGVMGLRLTSGQLVDASNAIEQFRGEVLLLPAIPGTRVWLRSVIVGVSALTIGLGIGLWLASRENRLRPEVVVAPPPEVFTDKPPQIPQAVEPKPSIAAPRKETLPPITVYRPPPPEKIKPPIPTPKNDRELLAPEAPLSESIARSESLPEARRADVAPTITIENVEISTSALLTEDLINYLRSVSLPQGRITIDVTIEEGKIGTPTIENDNPEAQANLETLLESWIPPERSGRVRLQISVP